MNETQDIEKKSLKLLTGKSPDWHELVRIAVCFANGRGGSILIGIEDDADIPPKNQTIDVSLPEKITKYIRQHSVNVGVATATIMKASNTGEYIEIEVYPSRQTIAGTSDGRYYLRISDECHPVMPDQLSRLAAEKNAFVWELQTTKRIPKNKIDEQKFQDFLDGVRRSDRVMEFVKNKTDDEILEQYFFVKDDYLTNLGILWIGQREDRAGLLYAPTIQFIRYDDLEKKVKKVLFDDYSLNPLELLSAVEKLDDWNESIEFPSGIFRNSIPIYNREVIRELVANALAHRVYVMQGDIFINLYTDRLEVHNPGLLPLGVTPSNILHQSVRRNEHLAKVFYDLKLMEREGSGYDKIYERLLLDGKRLPVVEERFDSVTVTVNGKNFNLEALRLMDKVSNEYQLKQREFITFGLIAQHTALSALELEKLLKLKDKYQVRSWMGKLISDKLVLAKGKTRGTEYVVNPALLQKVGYRGKTTLKQIENHRLRELLLTDLKTFPESSISEIHERIGKEIPIRKIRRVLKNLITEKIITTRGERKGRKYAIAYNQ
ncbi:MAG: ATP-binding protein [Bacteroidota bacterium]|nr:ATP-binding protein [Bacteroidota bacterium]